MAEISNESYIPQTPIQSSPAINKKGTPIINVIPPVVVTPSTPTKKIKN